MYFPALNVSSNKYKLSCPIQNTISESAFRNPLLLSIASELYNDRAILRWKLSKFRNPQSDIRNQDTFVQMQVQSFIFNPFAENTYVLYDDTRECIIIDPGCFDRNEESQLSGFIRKNELKPVRLINTHCHIDHVFGIPFVMKEYDLQLEIHKGELPVLRFAPQSGMMFGTPVDPMPEPGGFIEEGDTISFGNTKLEVLFTPGHSPASICFFDPKSAQLISGDVLFKDSIGRTDLPGGDYKTLMNSIFNKLMVLDDKVRVYPGHMDSTTIGAERRQNPFILEWQEMQRSGRQ